ncbi:hypothetical protein HJB80_02900 [Rhizobium lentis]|nr:hypothetical protein [Rhizobium lentis]
MTEQVEDDVIDALENEPAFRCHFFKAGRVLSEQDASDVQALLREIDRLEDEATETFENGRKFGIREVGGEELVAAVEAKDEAYIQRTVRITMDRLYARTEELKAEGR